AVIGAGGIGQLVAQAARAMGAAEIVIADRVPARLRVAEKLAGAVAVEDDLVEFVRKNPSLAPEVVFECAGSPHGRAQARAAVPVADFGRALRLAEDKSDGAVRVALDLQ